MTFAAAPVLRRFAPELTNANCTGCLDPDRGLALSTLPAGADTHAILDRGPPA